MNTEADANHITVCPHDDKPSTSMLNFFIVIIVIIINVRVTVFKSSAT